MPSRRSDRGGATRRQLERAEAAEPALKAAIEERKRFEFDRDHTYRVGFEEWDNLDTDTRQALFREAIVVSGIGDLAGIVTSPRRLGISQATKGILSRVAPNLAKRLYAASPRRSVTKLMDRIKRVRTDRAANRKEQQERLRQIERELKDNPPKPHDSGYRGENIPSPPKASELMKDNKFLMAMAVKTATNPNMPIVREMMRAEDEQGKKHAFNFVNTILELGESRIPHMSEEEKELRRRQKEEARADNMYTATDEEFEAVGRREKEHLKR